MTARAFFGQFSTLSKEVETMVCDVKFKNIAHHALYLLDSGVTEFQNMLAILANKMIVLLISVGLFKTS